MASRYYSAVAQDTTITSTITGSSTTVAVAGTTGYPGSSSWPFVLALDYNTSAEELVLVTNVSGLTLTITRGFNGTSAVSHNAGAVVRHVITAQDLTDAQTHYDKALSAGAHGVTGALATFLGSTTSANLAAVVSDETGSGSLVFGTSPTIASPVITGTINAGGVTGTSGQLLSSTGTGVAWTSVVGVTGPTGPGGSGTNGNTGATGNTGNTGNTVATGAASSVAGNTCNTGSTGPTGPNAIPINGAATGLLEVANIVASAATGTVNIDCVTSTYWYYTTNASANWTLNFRGNSGTTLNSLMSTGQSISAVFLNTNGSTAYYPSAFQVDGTAVTPKWAGGAAPAAGNASSIDAYTFTIIKTASATFTVIAGGAVKFA